MDDATVPQESYLIASADQSIGNDAPGYVSNPGSLENLSDLHVTMKLFVPLWCQSLLEGFADILDDLVDDVITTDVDALFLGQDAGPVVGRNIEAYDDGLWLRSYRQLDIALIDSPDARV